MIAKTVLLIDDDEFLLEVMTEIFRIEGFKVLTALSAGEGLCVAQYRRPDVIVSDWIMPGMSGYELVRELQNDQRTMTIPFVLMTGWSDAKGIEHWTGLPSEQIVPKPFDIATLVRAVKKLVQYNDYNARV